MREFIHEIQWKTSKATRPGKCSLSGMNISVGDDIYTTTTSDARRQVLASEYERYEKSAHQTLAPGRFPTMTRS